jgi:hypothetical protein
MVHVALPNRIVGPRGRTVVIRPASPDDQDAIAALYARLDPEDRYARFFTGSGVGPAFIEGWLTKPGNDVVIALVEATAVAEAGYAVDGAGWCQLGITVDRDHRGWLGPYLLDLVLTRAGEHGHPAVVADVLATNRSMLALVAARGYAVLPSDDLSVVRVLLGTHDVVPGWGPRRARRRALVELGHAGSLATQALSDAGYDVVACRGPFATKARRWRCPALAGRSCPLVAGADVVVTDAGRDARDADLLDAVRRLHPGVPLCVVGADARAADVVAAADKLQEPAGSGS